MSKINRQELHNIFVELRNKNQDAYNKLYENYYKLVYGIVFSIIKKEADSEDITHEVFTKIYKLDSSKLPVDNEASWLFTVSKNECFLFLRKSKPNISIEEIYEIPKNANEIDDVIDRDYYNKLISGLKEDEKIIVSLKVLSNFTFKKISQVMNLPIGTVQWKYYNSINSLKVSIGSLVGAVLAFVLIIVRGELGKEKEYLKNKNSSNVFDVKEKNDSESNINNSLEDSKINSSEVNNNDELINVPYQDGNTGTVKTPDIAPHLEVDSEQRVFNKDLSEFDGIQIASLAIGITLFIIFIIFFKKYQQKLKRKSSK